MSQFIKLTESEKNTAHSLNAGRYQIFCREGADGFYYVTTRCLDVDLASNQKAFLQTQPIVEQNSVELLELEEPS